MPSFFAHGQESVPTNSPDHFPMELLPSFPLVSRGLEPAAKPFEATCRCTSGPLHLGPSQGQGALTAPRLKPWARRVRSGQASRFFTADCQESSLNRLPHPDPKPEAAEAMQMCEYDAPPSSEMQCSQRCSSQMQLPLPALVAGTTAALGTAAPSLEPPLQATLIAVPQHQHIQTAQQQQQPWHITIAQQQAPCGPMVQQQNQHAQFLQPQPQLAMSHASARTFQAAPAICFSTAPSGPMQPRPSSPLVARTAGCCRPRLPVPTTRTCRPITDRAMSALAPAALQGVLQALPAEADTRQPGGTVPHSPQPSPLCQHPIGQRQHSLPESSQASRQSSLAKGMCVASPVEPSITATPEGSAVTAVPWSPWQSSPLQGWRSEGQGAHESDQAAARPALKRTRSSESPAGPVNLWQAVSSDRGFINEVC